jgi:hypothetical protein
MNPVARLLIPAALVIGFSLDVFACVPPPGPRPSRTHIYNWAGVMFVGKVTDIRPTPVKTEKRIVNGVTVDVFTPENQVRIAVEQVIKGTPGAEVTLARTGMSCDPSFAVNGTYVVFAASVTSFGALAPAGAGSIPLPEVSELLKYIDGVRSNRPQAFLHGDIQRKEGGPAGFNWRGERFTVQAEGNGLLFEAQSLDSGLYELTLPPGNYRVRLLRNGTPASNVQPVELPPGAIKLNSFDAFPKP